jgi:hypothetical protein
MIGLNYFIFMVGLGYALAKLNPNDNEDGWDILLHGGLKFGGACLITSGIFHFLIRLVVSI